MLKYLIIFLVILVATAGAQAAEDADREALSDAWRNYSELSDKGDYEASLIEARRGEYKDAERLFREALDVLDPSEEELQSLRKEVDQILMFMSEESERRDAEIASLTELYKAYELDPELNNTLPIIRVAPVYPESALREGSTGYVDFLFTVDEQGFVINPEIVKFTGHKSFQNAALGAVMRFRYAPRYVDGQAVAVQGVRTRITFEIEN